MYYIYVISRPSLLIESTDSTNSMMPDMITFNIPNFACKHYFQLFMNVGNRVLVTPGFPLIDRFLRLKFNLSIL